MIRIPLLVEEAYYWNYAQHLDYSYLDHPPMVALLIKLGILIWGDTEWGVRFATLPCWLLTLLFSYRLTQIIKPGAGKYTILFLSFLPFFFAHSLIITPDIPLIVAWSAALLYLYKATVLNKASNWYLVGVCMGLGLLSKYTIVLLGLATFFYLLLMPDMRHWFRRKEPYLAALIAFVIFSPVIYWNAIHQWASFLFQTSSRFHASDEGTLHLLLGLVILFFMPIGIIETARLFSFSKKQSKGGITTNSQAFFLLYTLTPVLFFAVFSMSHQIKINWIGPSLLAAIPWFATSMTHNRKVLGLNIQTHWAVTFLLTFAIYGLLFTATFLNWPKPLQHKLAELLPNWQNISYRVYQEGQAINSKFHEKPVIVALDKYNIASELIFYQNKLKQQKQIPSSFPVLGGHLFGFNSLMYKYWDDIKQAENKYILLVSNRAYAFDEWQVHDKTKQITLVKPLYKSNKTDVNPDDQLLYQVVKMK